LNMLLHDVTVKAVPDTIMLDLEREAINDGVLAWKCLQGVPYCKKLLSLVLAAYVCLNQTIRNCQPITIS
jgi:hypothetical protein